jgi:N-acetylglucosamine kinase-like BadF-type ATPase
LVNQDHSVAIALVREAAEELEKLYDGLIEKTGEVIPVSFLGGLAKHFMPWISDDVIQYVVPPVHDAMQGAIMMARQHCEVTA